MTTGGKSYYYLTDALGSVVALADETGIKVNTYAYSPRGVQRSTTTDQVPQPYRFAGGYQDPTGLYHYSARYYDPNIGRFTSPDPSGQEKNPYLYAEGDPVNRIDPGGLASFGFNLEGCYYLCLGGGLTVNDDGSWHPSLSLGAGSPGVSGGVEGSGGDANSGVTGELECSAGFYRASASTQGDTSAGASTEYSSNPKCSAKAKYTW